MRLVSRAAAVAMLLAAAGAAGPARAATQSWQIGDVSQIRVEGPFDVRVAVGQPSVVRATGSGDALGRVSVEQRGDVLVIRPQSGGGWGGPSRGGDDLRIEVGMRALAAATLSGSGGLRVDRARGDAVQLMLNGSGDLSVDDVAVDALKVTLNGPGDLAVTGHARTATMVLNGTGALRAGALSADEATVTAIGSGDVKLAATRTAKVTLNGSGSVAISGPAACTVTTSGTGDVSCGRRATGN
jgi:hypothetical protein